MNRIQHLAKGVSTPDADCPSVFVEAGRYEHSDQDAPLAFFSPLHYERNYSYPLIVWLHGAGDDERQLKRVMPLVSMRNYVAVAARGTTAPCDPTPAGDMPQHSGFTWSQTKDQILLAENRAFAALDAATCRFNVAATRVFVAGVGCGGTMALRLALEHPTVFAGVASFGGPFPLGHNPLGRLAEARRLRVLLATGRDSIAYPQESVCQHLRLFHVAGMSVCLRQYPSGDELSPSKLADMDRWIMDQIIAPPAVAEDESSANSDAGSERRR